jgi:hypothetical protein
LTSGSARAIINVSREREVNKMETLKAGIILMALLSLVGVENYFDSHHTRHGEIIGTDGTDCFVEDTTGNVWEFDEAGFSIGDKVTLKMYTNHTDSNIYDDIIVKVVKEG